MIRICITGYSGFVGNNLVKYMSGDFFLFFPIDLRKDIVLEDMSQADVIIHLAGKAHDLKKKSSFPKEYYEINTELTKKVFDIFLSSNAKTFIMLSSVKAVADSVNGILTEDIVPNPKTDYGRSKLLAEQYIYSRPWPPGKRVYLLRPCMIHGPGNKGNLNLLYNFLMKGIPYPLGSFDNRRSFLSVTNLCFVIRELCMRTDIASGIYHITDDQPLSTNRVIYLMGEALNRKVHFWRIPEKTIYFFARIGDSLGLPLNSERLNKLTENYVVSNAKLLTALQKQLPLTAEEGLRITLQSFTAKMATTS